MRSRSIQFYHNSQQNQQKRTKDDKRDEYSLHSYSAVTHSGGKMTGGSWKSTAQDMCLCLPPPSVCFHRDGTHTRASVIDPFKFCVEFAKDIKAVCWDGSRNDLDILILNKIGTNQRKVLPWNAEYIIFSLPRCQLKIRTKRNFVVARVRNMKMK